MTDRANVVVEKDLQSLVERASALKKRCAWEEIAALTDAVPPGELDGPALELADETGFALGQLGRTDEAARLFERVWGARPTRRSASALAYVYYDALLQRRGRGTEGRDREADRQAFIRWMQEALRLEPTSVKDLYRLGVFEAQVESRHDKAALRAFLKAVESYRTMTPEERARKHHLRKPYVRSLYGAARSALRLGDVARARRFVFDCIREDEADDHVEPVHKLYLAGRACAEAGQLDHAERAFRKALDAKGPPARDYVFAALAKLALHAGRPEDAYRWIDEHVPPHRRKPPVWRLVGRIELARGRDKPALLALQNSLRKDRAGRHLTLTDLGDLHLRLGKPKDAEQAYRQALDFRRRRYLSEHLPAWAGLSKALEAQGRTAEAAEAWSRIEAAANDRGPGLASTRHGARPPADARPAGSRDRASGEAQG